VSDRWLERLVLSAGVWTRGSCVYVWRLSISHRLSADTVYLSVCRLVDSVHCDVVMLCRMSRTAEAVPPPFRPSDPALCGSHPLVTPYYCGLGDLLCFLCVSFYCIQFLYVYVYFAFFFFFWVFLCSFFLQYFDTVGWVF